MMTSRQSPVPTAVSFGRESRPQWQHPAAIFALTFVLLALGHLPGLALPYYWDEAYFVSGARELLLTGRVVTQEVSPVGHPPFVAGWLAAWWTVLGFSPLVTRLAIIALAAFAVAQVFRLARDAAGTEAGWAAAFCTAVYPVFFAQSALAHLDMAAAAFTLWGIWLFLHRSRWAALAFSLAVLSKETAILAPLVLLGFEILSRPRLRPALAGWLLLPLLPLAGWYALFWLETGYLLGHPQFLQENVALTANLFWFAITLPRRLWQAIGYANLFVLTGLAVAAWRLRPALVVEGTFAARLRQVTFALGAAYVVAFSVVGRAVLARYMLAVVALVIVLAVVTLRQRTERWRWAVAVAALAFMSGWFLPQPYTNPPEDSLQYRDVITLHRESVAYIEALAPQAPVLASWPMAQQFAEPWLGYASKPLPALELADLSRAELEAWATRRAEFSLAVLVDYHDRPFFTDRLPGVAWVKRRLQRRPQLSLEEAAALLGGCIIWRSERGRAAAALVLLSHQENKSR